MTTGQWIGIVLIVAGIGVGVLAAVVLDDTTSALSIGGFVLGAAALIAGLVLTFNPNPHHLHSGQIISKHHSAGYWYPSTEQQCHTVYAGKTSSQQCITVTVQKYMPPDWSIKIKNCEQEAGKCLTGQIDVSPDQYGSLKVGDHYGDNADQ